MFIGKYNKSVILTYIGIAAAVLGIYFSFVKNIRYTLLCLIICGVCDLFDGAVARKCKRTEEEKLFGIEIDSLADIMNFVALPIAIFCGMGLTSLYNIIIYVVYALAAVTRLAYFNVNAKKSGTETPLKYYTGLPVTFSALIFTIFWFLNFYISEESFNVVYSLLMLVVALLFVLKIKVPKPKGAAYVVFALIAVAVSCFIIFSG
ncbi:CDP-alcohol phosphatidyltransferase family protein [Acetivibrio saccincola]|uniref:CDP-alcohol phosphatidyltransferase n=1 Tax=Acetivibrio saccincola TaxID=1677857 RepID=A0A2K9DWY5_9FIRM|nr:CDP-alcohol phosphatidyltransferase family protein [Acetivibrio saccincola]AUG56057.1 CDP-alcohol phosphatidyltransferase [Acetivibrio saccincola]HOA96220.1 CDP-alcohol phosphatidyltransferase family protein [Acetivibrio saccincola]